MEFVRRLESPEITVRFHGQLPFPIPRIDNGTVEVKVTRRKKVWQFPKERFATYEPSDESWCRYFGIGKEVEAMVDELVMPNAICVDADPDSGEFVFRGLR